MSQKVEKPTVDIKSIILEFFKNWKLFLIVGFICMSFTAVTYKFGPRFYRVKSVIIFKTDDNQASNEPGSYLEGYDIVNKEKQFHNEVLFYRSTPLIKKVIKDLNLETSYYMKNSKIPNVMNLGLNNIYKVNPFNVIFDKNKPQPTNTFFQVEIINSESYILSAYNPEVDLYNYKDDIVTHEKVYLEVYGKYKFGQQVSSDKYSFTITLNQNYNPEIFKDQDLYFVFENIEGLSLAFQNESYVKASLIDATIAEVYFTWENKLLAIEFLDALTNKYIEVNLEEKNKYASNTLDYIDRQLSSISDSLGFTEQQLQNFRTSYNVMDINEKSEQLYARLQIYEDERALLEQTRRVLQDLGNYFIANRESENIVAPSAAGLEDGMLSDLLTELNDLASERDMMIQNQQLRNPRLKTVNSSMGNLVNTILENIRFSLQSTNAAINEANSQITSVQSEISQLPQTQRRLINIERKYNMTDAAYTSLLEKRIQAQIAKASTEADCEIIEPTRYETLASPNVKLLLAIGLFLSFLIPSSIILLRNFFSNTINSETEISSITEGRTFGYIPYLSKATSSNVVNNFPHTGISEAFYTLRSNIAYKLDDKLNKVILVTSSVPNEGKSFTALNLATSFAKANNRILLIDFDLRKQSNTYNQMHGENISGLSHYLIGAQSLDEIIIETDITNLDYIPSGDIPPSTIELLASPMVKDLIETLKEEYDYIVIDTPPYALLTDAFMLMRFSDLNLYVVRLGIAQKKSFEYSIDDMRSKNIDNLDFLFNDSSTKSSSHHYKSSYYGNVPKKKGLFSRKKKLKTKQS